MTNAKSTKKALWMSVLSLVLCISMLIGTTFAWFTDSVTSANNIIKSGNLDIELEYWNGEKWVDVAGKSDILTNTLWEPGATEVAYFRIANAGSLALKYQFGINIVSETGGVNVDNEKFLLSDYIKFGVVENVNGKTGAYADRDAAVAAVTEAKKISAGYTKSNVLYAANNIPEDVMGAASEIYLALVVYMPTSVGNEANHKTGTAAPQIDLGINIFATQYTYEEDSYNAEYDVNAVAFDVETANQMLAANKDVHLVDCNDPDGILYVPANYTATLTLQNVTIKSVQAAADANIVINGNVVVNANGTGATTLSTENNNFNGSAISANGELNISGKGNLTAIAADVNGAFGIGGMNTTEINLKDVSVKFASGAYAYGVGSDTKYYKDAPEGGAAIGSGYNGAVINLDNVTVIEAIGGSKAAGIGARYHAGVTVNINNSVINYVEGGVSAAGIGGSRVSNGATEFGTTVNITASTVTAKGGAYGAGIGSGYDTHCQSVQPLCTINITDSAIKATGGQYAAGVGTGYHNAALAGEIKNSTINAASGEKIYKSSYTPAMDIGFGVTDPAREGQQTDSKLVYNGVVITMDSAPVIAENDADLVNKLQSGETNIMLGSGTYVLPTAAQGKTLTIVGSGDTVIATNTSGSYEGCNYALDGSTVVFENVIITTDNKTYTGYARCNATYNNCVINNSYTLYGNSTFNNCTLNVSGDQYNIWTWGAPNATFNNCTFNSDGKALLLYGQANTKLTLNGCTFNDTGVLPDKKAAVEIGNDYNTSYTLIANDTVVNGYEINDKGIFTGSTLWGNKNSMGTNKLSVTINGTQVYGPDSNNTLYIDSAAGLFAFAEQVNVKGNKFSGKTVALIADIDLENKAWTPIGQTGATEFKGTFDGNGYTISNLNIDSSAQTGENYSSGLFGWAESGVTIKNVTIDGATVVGNHNVAVIVGYTYSAKVINCHVTNANIVCNHANNDACGDKCGIIAGYAGDESRFTNCSATDCTVRAGRDAGQVIGCGYNVSVKDCSATNVTVSANGDCTGKNINEAVIGRVMG